MCCSRTRQSSTRGMLRDLFGSIGLMTPLFAVAEFIVHGSRSLNHAQDRKINGSIACPLLKGERTQGDIAKSARLPQTGLRAAVKSVGWTTRPLEADGP